MCREIKLTSFLPLREVFFPANSSLAGKRGFFPSDSEAVFLFQASACFFPLKGVLLLRQEIFLLFFSVRSCYFLGKMYSCRFVRRCSARRERNTLSEQRLKWYVPYHFNRRVCFANSQTYAADVSGIFQRCFIQRMLYKTRSSISP